MKRYFVERVAHALVFIVVITGAWPSFFALSRSQP